MSLTVAPLMMPLVMVLMEQPLTVTVKASCVSVHLSQRQKADTLVGKPAFLYSSVSCFLLCCKRDDDRRKLSLRWVLCVACLQQRRRESSRQVCVPPSRSRSFAVPLQQSAEMNWCFYVSVSRQLLKTILRASLHLALSSTVGLKIERNNEDCATALL